MQVMLGILLVVSLLSGCAAQGCWVARHTGYYCPQDYMGKE